MSEEIKQKKTATFSESGNKFSLFGNDTQLKINNLGEENVVIVKRDFEQIARDFLNREDDIKPFGPTDPFEYIPTKHSSGFIAGNGVFEWKEIKKKAKSECKENKRNCKK